MSNANTAKHFVRDRIVSIRISQQMKDAIEENRLKMGPIFREAVKRELRKRN